ncbi:MAG: molybdopterin-dependent oxidoreductase [Natronospirillum sp.]|uniref:nitrate reductase n=1 Tax=Natronospirillum sp. TaxID=2812955 RepID=UPI0025E79AC8|nr:nitrate reductase [Natronospirillum sp.]MCH8550638.1 molybdopterin-dependent oxidoreductase [Natronospirillum sp.]
MKRVCETTCPYCGVGCGVQATVQDDRVLAVSGDERHPANRGRLCVKGSALHETLSHEARLLHPEIQGQRADWDAAIAAVAEGLKETIRLYGPDSVAFYVSGQLLTEDYYVANKLMKGFIGSGNIDTNSRLCMSSAVAGYKRAFGSDTVPGSYEDIDSADLMVLIGSNAAWTHPVLFQRMQAARQKGENRRMVVIDPRRTATAGSADLHLPLRPGTDALLFNGLLVWLADHGGLDTGYVEAHTEGLGAALATARRAAGSLEELADECGLAVSDVHTFYQWFARTPRTVSFYSMGINQSTSGVDKSNAIINVHLATGRVGQPGASPFSITGQPNAMGGREVGGLSNQLAAHMDWDDPEAIDRVARFWNAANMAQEPGAMATELFERVHSGAIRAVWIMATNPVVSMPEAARVREALAQCDLVVVSDCMAHTDTMDLAHIRLPATGWSEKDGTVTNSERRISRQRALVKPAGEARHDWWIISRVAQAMGFDEAFGYQAPVDIFREHAQLTAYENNGTRDLDLAVWADITAAEYQALTPLQWPVNDQWPMGRTRWFQDGRFNTPSRRGRLFPVQPRPPQSAPDSVQRYRFNTGRLRDQWHTMTRTGLAARLTSHVSEPRLAMHPEDAGREGLQDRDWVCLRSAGQAARVRIEITKDQRRGDVFLPIHWTRQYASQAVASSLVPTRIDPISGQPELKHAVIQLEPWQPEVQGYCWLPEPLQGPPWAAWFRRDLEGGTLYQWAGNRFSARQWLEARSPEADFQIYSDAGSGAERVAAFVQGQLKAVIWLGQALPDIAPEWIAEQFSSETIDAATRRDLLAGRSSGVPDVGPMICSCHQIGRFQIEHAILAEGCCSVEALGRELRCGTQCGSCIPDLRDLLQANAEGEA